MQQQKEYNYNHILDEVAKVSTKLMIGDSSLGIETEPFYGHFFTGLVKKVGVEVDTLAVGYQNRVISLYINPVFWTEILDSIQYKLGGIKHEILHIVFKHIFRYKNYSNKIIFNVAADLVVNQYVKGEHLIKGAVLLDNFPELQLEVHQHVHYYYEKLFDLYKQCTKDEGGEEDEKGKGGGTGGENEQSQSQKEEENDMRNSKSWKNLKNFLDQDARNQKRHALWKNIDELSSAEKDMLESAINQALENALNRIKPEDFGNLPAGLQKYLQEFEKSQKPVVNWRRILRLFTNSSSHTQIKNTLRRPSKRYGTNPGIKVKKKQKILVALDTSGSISMEELKEFFSEIYHIWKQGAEILVVECDAKIHQTYLYTGKLSKMVKGGGGTAFEAPLHYANDTYRPDALIYFTDGYGTNPNVRCFCPIMWLLSKNGANLDYIKEFQGRKVKMT